MLCRGERNFTDYSEYVDTPSRIPRPFDFFRILSPIILHRLGVQCRLPHGTLRVPLFSIQMHIPCNSFQTPLNSRLTPRETRREGFIQSAGEGEENWKWNDRGRAARSAN